jgi:hypothetical protein
MACKLLIAGVLGASLLSTAAFAGVTALGNLDPDDAAGFGDLNTTGVADAGTFSLTIRQTPPFQRPSQLATGSSSPRGHLCAFSSLRFGSAPEPLTRQFRLYGVLTTRLARATTSR